MAEGNGRHLWKSHHRSDGLVIVMRVDDVGRLAQRFEAANYRNRRGTNLIGHFAKIGAVCNWLVPAPHEFGGDIPNIQLRSRSVSQGVVGEKDSHPARLSIVWTHYVTGRVTPEMSICVKAPSGTLVPCYLQLLNLTQLFDLSLIGRRDQTALEFEGVTYTFGDIDARSNRMAPLLASAA